MTRDDGVVLRLDYTAEGRRTHVRPIEAPRRCRKCDGATWLPLPPGALHAPRVTAAGLVDCSGKVSP